MHFHFSNIFCLQTNDALYLQSKHDIRGISCHNLELEILHSQRVVSRLFGLYINKYPRFQLEDRVEQIV